MKNKLCLAEIFSDHCVLQHDVTLAIWGWGEIGHVIEIKLAGIIRYAKCGHDGKFIAHFPPVNIGGPWILSAIDVENHSCKVICRDVMIGEVWLASGQSNMEFPLNKLGRAGEIGAQAAGNELLRLFTVARSAAVGGVADVKGEWLCANSDNSGTFSAVGYYFGEKLQRKLDCAVGVVVSAWGGTVAEAWCDRSALTTIPELATWLAWYDDYINSAGAWGVNGEKSDYIEVSRSLLDKECPLALADSSDKWPLMKFSDNELGAMEVPGYIKQNDYRNGLVWFWREILIPEEWQNDELYLKLGAIDKCDVTFLNGCEVGRTGEGHSLDFYDKERNYLLPNSCVKFGEKNLLAVRIDSFIYDGGFATSEEQLVLINSSRKASLPLAGKWRYKFELVYRGLGEIALLPGEGMANSPHRLFDNMIAPLIPFALRGVIWYQGESNADSAAIYAKIMEQLIFTWRRAWQLGDFPFIQVQLANYQKSQICAPGCSWARLREAQEVVTNNVANVHMVTAIDCGYESDIHPQNKATVGNRLADVALKEVYNCCEREVHSPQVEDFELKDNHLLIKYRHCGRTLRTVDYSEVVNGYAIFDSGLNFYPVSGIFLDERRVKIELPKDFEFAGFVYGWANNPKGINLCNSEGIPALPFRSCKFL